jgi:DNA polymerase-3 subunit alpha
MKHLITLSTPEGIIMVKVYRSQYAVYDKIVSRMEDGVKIIDEDSFFKKGTFLLISGIKRGEYFVPKVYKKMDVQPIMRIAVDQNKKFVNAYGRV